MPATGANRWRHTVDPSVDFSYNRRAARGWSGRTEPLQAAPEETSLPPESAPVYPLAQPLGRGVAAAADVAKAALPDSAARKGQMLRHRSRARRTHRGRQINHRHREYDQATAIDFYEHSHFVTLIFLTPMATDPFHDKILSSLSSA